MKDVYDGSSMNESKVAPKRSMLVQDRSRETRKSIIKAALALWGERGYDTGIDETTAEQIAARAGVAKATFYLHFARKEDILFEAGWLTSEVLHHDALNEMINSASADHTIDALMVKLCRRVERVPRAALRRMAQVMQSRSDSDSRFQNPDHFGFQPVFSLVIIQAQQSGDIPTTVAARELGTMLETLLYRAIRDWAYSDSIDLLGLVRQQMAVVLAGARAVTADALGPR
jgi:AcrR family transcriptional regulator